MGTRYVALTRRGSVARCKRACRKVSGGSTPSRHTMERECIACHKLTSNKKFCSVHCSVVTNNATRTLSDLSRSKIATRMRGKHYDAHQLLRLGPNTPKHADSILDFSSRTVRKVLQRLGVGCGWCGWNEGGCDVHHIHGRKIPNANAHTNLAILCPNCHRLVHEHKILAESLKTLAIQVGDSWKAQYGGTLTDNNLVYLIRTEGSPPKRNVAGSNPATRTAMGCSSASHVAIALPA